MEMLYAPWREEYTTDTAHGPKGQETADASQCVFCTQFKAHKDDDYMILARYTHSYIMMNKYPYNSGHLLVLPIAHKANLDELPTEARTELMELITHSTSILKKELNAHGMNVGLNLGKAAGAGMPSHLHFHVLPRWNGDTNFLPTLANTKQISTDLVKLFFQLKPHFQNLI